MMGNHPMMFDILELEVALVASEALEKCPKGIDTLTWVRDFFFPELEKKGLVVAYLKDCVEVKPEHVIHKKGRKDKRHGPLR